LTARLDSRFAVRRRLPVRPMTRVRRPEPASAPKGAGLLAATIAGMVAIVRDADSMKPFPATAETGSWTTLFGGDGRVFVNLSPRRDTSQGVAIDAAGRIVAAGSAAGRFAIARILGS
jgi:hypothetical protein